MPAPPEVSYGAAEVRVNLGDLPDGWFAGPADDVTCSETVLAPLASATSVSRSYGGEEFTDGQGSSVESDAFVYLSAGDAREAWLAVSSPAYAECVIAEARRRAQARGVQLVPGEVLESPVGVAEEGVSAVRLVYRPAAGEARPTVVDRVWIQRAGALVGLRLARAGEPFDSTLARRLVAAVAGRTQHAAVEPASLQQPSPTQPPAQRTVTRALRALVKESDLPPGWAKARGVEATGSICSNELLRLLGAKPRVVYGDAYASNVEAGAGTVDSIVYLFSTDHEARWGLERLSGRPYMACAAARDGEPAADAAAFRERPSTGLGERSRAGGLVAGAGGDERLIASTVWIQQGALIGGIDLTSAGGEVDLPLARRLAEGMAAHLAP